MEFRKGSEFSFRELYGKYIQILDKEQSETLVKPIDIGDGEIIRAIDCDMEVNSTFVHAYIDHEAGMSFQVLTVGFYDGAANRIHERTDFKSMVNIRKDKFNDFNICVLEDDSSFKEEYGEYVANHDRFFTSEDLERIRNFKAIDSLRDDIFPDDIMVVFFKEGMQNEGMWVRLEKMDDELPIINGEEGEFPLLYGKLLNQPNQDLGVNIGDDVRVALIRYENGEVAAFAV